MLGDERDHRRTVPFGRSDLAADLASLAIDEQRCRRGVRLHFARHLSRRVDVDAEHRETRLPGELLDSQGVLAVDRERKHKKLGVVERRLEAMSRSTLNNLDTPVKEFKELAGEDVCLEMGGWSRGKDTDLAYDHRPGAGQYIMPPGEGRAVAQNARVLGFKELSLAAALFSAVLGVLSTVALAKCAAARPLAIQSYRPFAGEPEQALHGPATSAAGYGMLFQSGRSSIPQATLDRLQGEERAMTDIDRRAALALGLAAASSLVDQPLDRGADQRPRPLFRRSHHRPFRQGGA
jgi:hypothetical protein